MDKVVVGRVVVEMVVGAMVLHWVDTAVVEMVVVEMAVVAMVLH